MLDQYRQYELSHCMGVEPLYGCACLYVYVFYRYVHITYHMHTCMHTRTYIHTSMIFNDAKTLLWADLVRMVPRCDMLACFMGLASHCFATSMMCFSMCSYSDLFLVRNFFSTNKFTRRWTSESFARLPSPYSAMQPHNQMSHMMKFAHFPTELKLRDWPSIAEGSCSLFSPDDPNQKACIQPQLSAKLPRPGWALRKK